MPPDHGMRRQSRPLFLTDTAAQRGPMPYAFSIKGKKAEYKRRAGKGGAKARRRGGDLPRRSKTQNDRHRQKRKKLPVPQKGKRDEPLAERVRRKTKQENHGGRPAEKCGGRIKRKNPCTPGGVRDFFCFRGRSGVLIPRIAWPGANRLTRFPPAARFRRQRRRAGRWCRWRCAQARPFARRTIPGTGWRRR